jgi:GTPase involved in cell partitioning and DNA repair
LFERAGLLRHEQAKIVLKEYVDSENLDGEGSFETVEIVSVEQEKFESQLRDEIVELIYEGKVDEEQARSLAESVAESISEQYS